MPLLVLGGLGSPFLITGGLAAATAPPPSSGGTGGSVVTRGLGRGALVIRGLGASTGGTPASPSIVLTGYPGYFTGFITGFRTAYYPGSSGGYGIGRAVVVLPGTFVAAVRATLKADAVLNELLIGGWWNKYIPPGVPRPVGMYAVTTDRRRNVSNKAFIEEGSIRLTVLANRDLQARDIANHAVDVLTDAGMAWGLYDGRLMYLSLNTPLSSDMPSRGYGGAKTFASERVLDFVHQGVEYQG